VAEARIREACQAIVNLRANIQREAVADGETQAKRIK